MPHVSKFRAKWEFYKPRACKISAHFLEFEGQKLTQDNVAARIPKDAAKKVPATDGANIASAAFGDWLAKDNVPDNRIQQWQDLTGLPIDTWKTPLSSFERAVRQRTGETLGWPGLVQARALRGPLRVRARDREIASASSEPQMRFMTDGYDPDERPVDVQLVWPGCIAQILAPCREPRDDEDRRAWLLADYGERVFMLDPAKSKNGQTSSSRIVRSCWRSDRREGHIVFPRAAPGYLWIPPSAKLGTRFDVIVLTLKLPPRVDEIRAPFDALEQRWLMDPSEGDYQKTVRASLEEAAALIDGHEIGHVVYAQTCEVVDRAKVMGASHG